MHLTNYSINKKNEDVYTPNNDEAACQGHKWLVNYYHSCWYKSSILAHWCDGFNQTEAPYQGRIYHIPVYSTLTNSF